MSSPSYTDHFTASLTSVSTESHDTAHKPRYNPATPDSHGFVIDEPLSFHYPSKAYSEDQLLQYSGARSSFEQIFYEEDLLRRDDASMHAGRVPISFDSHSRATAQGVGLVTMLPASRSFAGSTSPIDSAPFLEYMLASGPTPPVPASDRLVLQVLCQRCCVATTLTAAPGQTNVVVPLPCLCPSCSVVDAMDQLNADNHILPFLPISKDQSRAKARKAKSQYSCLTCGRTFGRRADMERHDNSIHRNGDGKQCVCNMCGYTITRSDKMKEHCRKKHGQQFGEEDYSEA